MTAQENYDQYVAGYKWKSTWGGEPLNYKCNTCDWAGNVPPGFVDSRPAGGSTVTYRGYGISTMSLDEAWDIYIKANGGMTSTQTQEQKLRVIAEEAVRIASDLARKLELEAEQIALKKQMLTRGPGIFVSEEAYARSIDIVNASVDAFNPQIEAYQLARSDAEKAIADAAAAKTEKEKTGKASGLSLLLLPVIILIAIILIIVGRK